MQSREGLLKYILESLKMQVPTPCDLDRFMDVVSDNLHSPTIILLHEISVGLERCPENEPLNQRYRDWIEEYQFQGLGVSIISCWEIATFTYFYEWLDEVEEALEQNTALLALDEFEELDKAIAKGRFDEQDVLGMLRHLIQHRPRFKILLAGSHTIAEYQRWASYLINVQLVHISYLKEAEARQLIERPVKDFTLRYEPNAVPGFLTSEKLRGVGSVGSVGRMRRN
ncbi:hypothetical protein [Nostoc sp. C117]|uniref:hypothetical protein n=1 Tax=Nostoc sp. C117 TaxID=3349875 RepID=UPI00370D4AF0